MKAAIFRGNQQMEITEVPDPVCPDGGLVLRIEACGICGSDVRTYKQTPPHPSIGRVIGHEVAGVVVQCGSAQSTYKVGDALVLDSIIPCGQCSFCQRGQQNLCDNWAAISGSRTGGYAQLMAVPEEAVRNACCVPIPAGLSFAEATVAETLSSATKGHELLDTSLGDTVVVIGAGPLGNMLVELARLRGAAKVVQTQRSQGRLEMARQFGADMLISAATEDPVKRVLEETGGRGADIVICAAPSVQAAADAVLMACKGGKVMWFAGLPPKEPNVPVNGNVVHYRELALFGTFGYAPRHFQLSVDLVASRKIDPAKYVTHVLPLEQINEGFREAIAGRALKVVIQPST
jgi:L-iditol 2-dehydrogenase